MLRKAIVVLCQIHPNSDWERLVFRDVVNSFCEEGALVMVFDGPPEDRSKNQKKMIAPGCWRTAETVEEQDAA